MSKQAKDAVIRFRVEGALKARLEKIAAARKTSISELAIEALEAVYPELSGVYSRVSTRGRTPPLSTALTEQTSAIRELIEILQPARRKKGGSLEDRKGRLRETSAAIGIREDS